MTTILLVDDEPDILLAFRELLGRRLQADVQTAESAQAALEVLEKRSFDLLVADQRMPGVSGIELIQLAKAKAHGMRCVLFTAYRDDSLEKRALARGADLVLSKSTLPVDFAQRLREVLTS